MGPRRLIFVGLILSLAATAALAWFLYELNRFLFTPAGATVVTIEGKGHMTVIKPGMSVKQIAHMLEEQAIVTDADKFRLCWRIRYPKKIMQAGEYQFSAGLSPLQIMELLINGRVILNSITIPEGLTMKEIIVRLHRIGQFNPGKLSVLTASASRLEPHGISARSLEGYLFPDTYLLPKSTNEEQVVSTMVARFFSVWRTLTKKHNEIPGFSLHEIVTLASLIEKETAVDDERSIISAVYHNRLKRRMLLQCDPTVIYGLPDFNGNLTRKDLEYDSPYNTYRYPGLPPGPICNPGQASLEAALSPADVPYIFFVARGDKSGRHVFSTTLQEHNTAVYREQILPRRRGQ